MQSSTFMTSEELRVTADDVVELNRSVLLGTARFGRLLGTVLMAIGALGGVLWLWVVLRQQDVIGGAAGPLNFGLEDAELSPKQRLDSFATSFSFLSGVALTAGLGMALRIAGECVIAEKGGSLTQADVGDPLPTAADQLPWLADDDDGGDDDDDDDRTPSKGP